MTSFHRLLDLIQQIYIKSKRHLLAKRFLNLPIKHLRPDNKDKIYHVELCSFMVGENPAEDTKECPRDYSIVSDPFL